METYLQHHFTYNSRVAWHTVYAMLPSNFKLNASSNSYNGKSDFLNHIIHSEIIPCVKCHFIGDFVMHLFFQVLILNRINATHEFN